MFRIGEDLVALVTDSACDLSDAQLRRYDIRLVSLRITTTKGQWRDRAEIQPEKVYEMMQTELPKTSLPLPEDVSRLYRGLREEGCTRILHIAMSSGLSGTFRPYSSAHRTEEMAAVSVRPLRATMLAAAAVLVQACTCQFPWAARKSEHCWIAWEWE